MFTDCNFSIEIAGTPSSISTLFDGSDGSLGSLSLTTVAIFSHTVSCSTSGTITANLTSTLAPASIRSYVHVIVPFASTPFSVIELSTKVKPVGISSVMTTSVAAPVPLFVTVIMYVTLSPSTTETLLLVADPSLIDCCFEITNSGTPSLISTSFDGVGSVGSSGLFGYGYNNTPLYFYYTT